MVGGDTVDYKGIFGEESRKGFVVDLVVGG